MEVGNAPMKRRSARFWMVSRGERSVLVADQYAGRPYSILDDVNDLRI